MFRHCDPRVRHVPDACVRLRLDFRDEHAAAFSPLGQGRDDERADRSWPPHGYPFLKCLLILFGLPDCQVTGYSLRKAAIGSMRDARRAGTQQASTATRSNMKTTTEMAAGSRDSVSNRNVLIHFPAASAAATPTSKPTNTG